MQVHGRPHLVLPYGLANNDAKFIRGGMATGQDFFEYLKDAFDMLYREGAAAAPHVGGPASAAGGSSGRAAGLERFLDHVARQSGVWVCGRADIARHWLATHPPR